jgi:signal transduction histidine kinase
MPSPTADPPAVQAVRPGGQARLWIVAAVLLPLGLTALLHWLSLQSWRPDAADTLTLGSALVVADAALQPPATAAGVPAALPFSGRSGVGATGHPLWLVSRFSLDRPADTTWALSFAHRTEVLVYLDGRLLANSVPLAEADRTPRNLQIGERRLTVSVPADWLQAGAHEIAVRLTAAGLDEATLSPMRLGPAPAVEAAERPRRLSLALRVLTMLSALLIGIMLLFAWLVDRRERLYLASALHLMTLALLLSPYVLGEPPLAAPWWRMLLDGADVLAKGLAAVVIVAWAAPRLAGAQRIAFGYMALALPIDLLAAYHDVPWDDFAHPWPWWALGSRLALLALSATVALAAFAQRPGPHRFGTALLAGLALWIWVDVTLFAVVWPGVVGVVDLNVVAYAGWTLWVAVLLHRRLVHNRQREQQLRDELAAQLLQRSEQLHAQYAALQSSEQARAAAAERERLLQEMHDGLGAQLASAKMLASGGQLSGSEMVDVLDACLREMRLTVDALGVTDGDLGVLLATLRHRLEPVLRAGGIALDWRVQDAPCVPVLEGTGGRELARIVQEALANIVHHAGASRVEIGTRSLPDGSRVQIRIVDDGRGMPADPSLGRGLRGIRQRAARLGARVEWRAPPIPARGTELLIELPLAAGATPPAGSS